MILSCFGGGCGTLHRLPKYSLLASLFCCYCPCKSIDSKALFSFFICWCITQCTNFRISGKPLKVAPALKPWNTRIIRPSRNMYCSVSIGLMLIVYLEFFLQCSFLLYQDICTLWCVYLYIYVRILYFY